MRIARIPLLLLVAASPTFAASPQTMTLPRDVATFVAPVLDAHAAVAVRDDSKGDAALSEKIERVLNSHTPAHGLIADSKGHYDEAEYQRQLKVGAPPMP